VRARIAGAWQNAPRMTAAASSRPATPSFVYVVTAFAAVGGLLLGYDTGVISGALPFLKREFSLTTFAEEVVTSAVLAGALVGAALAGRLADRYGRRPLILFAGSLYVVGAAAAAFAPSADLLGAARLALGVAMASFQQITGINTVIYYAPEIFAQAGFEGAASQLGASLVVASVNVLATLIAVRWLDRVGRRPLLVAGLIGMGVSLALLGALFASSASGDLVAPASVALLAAYVACFAFSLGPIVWVLISEIYPLRVRGLAVSVATMANWGANLVFVLRRVPETKGRTLEAQWKT
jgi:MFS family permease